MTHWIVVSGRYFLPDGLQLSKRLTKFVKSFESVDSQDIRLGFTVGSVIEHNDKSFFVIGIELLES